MKIGIISLLLLATVGPALASPQPAGKCSLIDDGVASYNRPTTSMGANHDTKPSRDPNVISMVVPPILGNRVVDVAFHINADGTVTGPKVLCISFPGNGIEASILNASKRWRFSPMMKAGEKIATDAAYRISASGTIPLTFSPQEIVRPID
jgi:TonB family protein